MTKFECPTHNKYGSVKYFSITSKINIFNFKSIFKVLSMFLKYQIHFVFITFHRSQFVEAFNSVIRMFTVFTLIIDLSFSK